MKSETHNDFIDSLIWKKAKPTYAQVHRLGLTSRDACRTYVINRWGSEVGPRGITIRSNKLWDAVCGAVRALPSDSIEGSVWRVTYNVGNAIHAGEIEGWSPDVAAYRVLSDYDSYSVLGWVIADNESEAMMTARVILGPRAHSSSTRVHREGVSTWNAVKDKNREHAKKLRKFAEIAKEICRLKLIEIENLECQVSFLEVGATFDSNVKISQE